MVPKTSPSRPTPTPRRKPLNEKHIISFLFAICVLITLFLGTLLFAFKALDLPAISSVSQYHPLQATEILDRHGKVMERIYIENRTVLSLSKMPPLLPKAFVAAEDGRFYDHPGLDFWSVFRAFINNAREGRRSQGGSTITQQVARSLLLSPEKTYLRKFKEAILAWRIDSLLSKEEILYIYLNQIYLGGGAYGVEAAAQVYFSKHVQELTLGEMAILAGLPQAPSRYSPFEHLERAQQRQRYVLNRMVEDGYVSGDAARRAFVSAVELKEPESAALSNSGYFVQLVRKRAEQELGVSLNYAGVRIFTTLDPAMQVAASRAVRQGVMASLVRSSGKSVTKGGHKEMPQGALVSIEACTGRVRALVGGLDFTASPFDRATQGRRSAGSVFKPLIYATALENGFGPQSMILDAPLSIRGHGGKLWQPQNFSGQFHGETTLSEALTHSLNVVAVRLLQKVGVDKVRDLAKSAGISEPITADLSLALGATGVSLLEITGAYAPFVCGGQFTSPILITRIEDGAGRVLMKNKPESRRVLDAKVAAEMQRMLAAVISDGTGKRAGGLPGLCGGKTGTTDENRDAWFVGFTRMLITGVWLGYDQNRSLGREETGGRAAAPIWLDFMRQAQ
ncbi:MAG: PBP1A family penicillin-binding protein [Proteobacteria bacterium]|nr:PBP1A family penicillin-binding protein [Desulfocapsa sp.]MBU3943975.1 PBP1A family penicillin-binding protein [Pseudomonadota bacterium]MCG2742302.1 PBP1A family penicillin-binding protein [Desulfobacteraceae bacterium]MBU3983152.1 PBP1A family penicillin-binding protein [Pseudomonadota bacterium]MBU4028268.1 PBP1A family penicillin-binding protein [Pseudomonadota bacterium]